LIFQICEPLTSRTFDRIKSTVSTTCFSSELAVKLSHPLLDVPQVSHLERSADTLLLIGAVANELKVERPIVLH
jgi:hypothetical protein